jgi:hypothetical protein
MHDQHRAARDLPIGFEDVRLDFTDWS